MLGLLGALDPYKHKLNQTGGMLVDGDSAAISKDITDNDAGNNIAFLFFSFSPDVHYVGLEIKKIFRSPFGYQPDKYSRQTQIFSRQFVKCK